ncbi:MAG: ABC transporter ATP-binding protein [Candidatus Omnitrophica bacterium]|nr:ABC transporter ATP-binding protein [Candidatus Omnitrophota bacterium]MBI2105029.1 ABC transporter ATP-binding protein [Candidatus Omnitrophota bacterium]
MTSAIAVRQLVKRFGSLVAVDHLDFSVAPRETVVLWGANGAGKTTVLRCVLGIVPFDGSIQVLGHEVCAQGKAARAKLGYVPQEIRFPGEQTVWETVAFYARLRRLAPARATALLDQWQLLSAARQPVRTLSGGMKQKLALVVALLPDPPVLLLDEPTSNLDAASRREFSVLLDQLKRSGKTLLCCLHRVGEVWKLADRVVVLEQGRKISEGPPQLVAASLSARTVVCLTVAHDRMAQAAGLLAARGFAVERNGMQLWVGVPEGRKVEPIQRLLEAGIPLLDLELGNP